MVREAIGSALPKPRKKTERPRWKLRAAVDFVDAVLEADRKAPRKQRHTAHRIWQRIQHELPDCKIGERTVRQYVHSRITTTKTPSPFPGPRTPTPFSKRSPAFVCELLTQDTRCPPHCTGSRDYEHSGARKVRPRSEDYANETEERRAVRI